MSDIPFIVYRTDADMHLKDLSLDPTDRSGETIWERIRNSQLHTP